MSRSKKPTKDKLSPKTTKEEVNKPTEDTASKASETKEDSGPLDVQTVEVVIISSHPLPSPYGIVCRPNDPEFLPDEGWVKAQEAAGLLKVKR